MFIYRNNGKINNKNFAFCKLEGKLSTCVNPSYYATHMPVKQSAVTEHNPFD